MKRAVLVRVAPLALMLVTGVVSCSPTLRTAHPTLAARPLDQQKFGEHALERARLALAGHDATAAVAAAEIAVAALPERADARTVLGQSYLSAGRFASAGATFADALTLDPRQERAAFGRTLALIGAGRTADARSALASLPDATPAADRGLALALAGDRVGAIAVLEAAARQAGADSRVRQNLALAHALAGDWAKASAVAAQDVQPGDLAPRLAGWAQFVQAPSPADQVALLLGTVRVSDPGVPQQIALARAPESAPVSSAVVEVAGTDAPAVTVALAPSPPMAPPLPARANLLLARTATTAPMPARVPLLLAAATPYKRAPMIVRTPVRLAAAANAAGKMAPGGSFVVQLGAFRDAGRVERAWSQSTGRLARLATYTPSSTTLLSATHSATLTRLSIAGFQSHDSAMAVCGALRHAGGDCFVRQVAGDNPVHWASRDVAPRA